MQVSVIGAGIAGLCCALEFAERGVTVEVLERGADLGPQSCSWYAGGMLAPWCELEDGGEPLIAQLGEESLAWWASHLPEVRRAGTLVIAPSRERPELTRFAARTQRYRWLDRVAIATLEPELAERFDTALYFPDEGHLDPRSTLASLVQQLRARGGRVRYHCEVDDTGLRALGTQRRFVIDCRGFGARSALGDLRGVRGEMILLQSAELSLQRPIRLLHPRFPLYVVPRERGVYMLGATMLESEDSGPMTARAALELLSAAYAVHPAFGEARILEFGAQVRPAFADNLPQLRRLDNVWVVNGFYRHGFLIAPAMAARVADLLLKGRETPELLHEDRAERRFA